jgi:hypothetical protein
MEGDNKSMRSHEVPKKEVQTAENPEWLIVYLCKMPAVVEGFKKLRVAFIEKKDCINDCICHSNPIE